MSDELKYIPALKWFTREMEKKLSLPRNVAKTHWQEVSLRTLISRLQGEVEEAHSALLANHLDQLITECADVANYAMMIADKARSDMDLGCNWEECECGYPDRGECQKNQDINGVHLRPMHHSEVKTETIDIVFDGPPGPESANFVEVENPEGESIKVGEWVEREDGTWALRLERVCVDK